MNNLLLALIVNILPKLTLVVVSIVFIYKIYFKIRCLYSARVNCWFCNQNSKVPYLESNSWTCTKCEQYNGFSKDGGYNREIIQQFDCNNSNNEDDARSLNYSFLKSPTPPSNGFCDSCNESQRLKVEKLAQFEPKWESRFDEELKVYKAQLEEQYRLCATCDRHLKSVLRDKKKMVLGSKFLEYIIKGAEAIKQPHYNLMRQAKQELWKRRLSVLITVLTFMNLFCLFGSLPELNRTWFYDVFGTSFGTHLFITCSHIAALWRVLVSYLSTITQSDFVIRLGLFTRTVFMMLLYSLGLRLPHLVRVNFLSLYLLAAPFCILTSTFSYNVIDRFRITRYTLLLVLWSLYTGGLIESSILPTQQVLMFLTSVLTCVLTFTNKVQNSSKIYNDAANSFHKIYADDYLSDGDTATSTIFSQYSTLSTPSDYSRSYASMHRSPLHMYDKKSPLTSSTFSLNTATRQPHQPYDKTSPLSSSMLSLNLTPQPRPDSTLNSSFRSCYGPERNNTSRPRFGNSVYSFAAPSRNPFMNKTSNMNFINTSHLKNNSFGNKSFSENFPGQKSKVNEIQQCLASPTPSFRSTFGTPNNTFHNQERPSRLLSPSRFAFNNTTDGFANNANNFTCNPSLNQCTNQASALNQTNNHTSFVERRNGLGTICPLNEDLSRASSRSSGFESQNGHINNSRENSYCDETNDVLKRSAHHENSSQFCTIDANNGNYLNTTLTEHPLVSPPYSSSYSQPLSVNCSSEWHTANRSNTTAALSRNTFNLGRFNQNLPSFKRGDLLKRWKEGEVMS